MMKDPLISVIVPVYNVEKYLDRCVSSIVNQTYRYLEIILVDDGSPDRCPQMCDAWARRDSRVRTVHRENGGLSCARNTGLSVASGDYITFVDSDDWIVKDAYEYCINLFNKYEGADAVQFGLVQTTDEDVVITQHETKEEVFYDKDILQFYMFTTTTTTGSYSVCRCMFKASLVKRYKFREGKINEDIDFKYKVLRDCHEFVVSDRIQYFYWQGGSSTSSGKFKARDLQLYDAADELYRLTKDETYGDIAFLGKVKKARTPFSLLCRIALWGMNDQTLNEEEVVSRLTKENRKNLPILLKAPLPLSRKILVLSFAVSYKATKGMMRLGRIIMKL